MPLLRMRSIIVSKNRTSGEKSYLSGNRTAMPRILFLIPLLTVLLLSCNTSAQNDYLLRFETDAGTGYQTVDGEVVIPSGKYDMCFTDPFRTYAVVAKEDGK